MKTMLRYELKKVFIRRSSRIALILLAVLVVGSGCLAVMGIDYINEDGEKENGTAAIHKLRDAKQEWAGELTEEVIRRVIEENHAIDASVDKETANVRELDMAYSKKQGFLDIRQLITYAFCGFQEYDYYKIDSLSPESAKEFEGRRLAQLKEWLGSDGADQLTDKEKSFLTEKYEEFRFPIRYSPADGWRQLIEHAPMVTMFTVLILGFLTSGIFSSEFRCKTNDIFFSSCYGRDRAIKASGLGLYRDRPWNLWDWRCRQRDPDDAVEELLFIDLSAGICSYRNRRLRGKPVYPLSRHAGLCRVKVSCAVSDHSICSNLSSPFSPGYGNPPYGKNNGTFP